MICYYTFNLLQTGTEFLRQNCFVGIWLWPWSQELHASLASVPLDAAHNAASTFPKSNVLWLIKEQSPFLSPIFHW
jgi:hypothetical protein